MSDFTEAVRLAFQRVLPRMISDGGGATLALVDEANKTAQVELIGSCRYCPSQIRSASALVKDLFNGCPDLARVEVFVTKGEERERLISRGREDKISQHLKML